MSPEQIAAGLKARTKKTRVTWQASNELSLDEWKAAGPGLGLQTRASPWWLGDWVRFGAKRYGLSVSEAAAITGYEEQTLYNMVSIAAKFPVSRRREKLSWSHHSDVSALSCEEQERWLDLAQDERLSVVELRQALRRDRRAARKPGLSPSAEDLSRGAPHLTCPHCGETVQINQAVRRRLVANVREAS